MAETTRSSTLPIANCNWRFARWEGGDILLGGVEKLENNRRLLWGSWSRMASS
jgi:hypothetical protein